MNKELLVLFPSQTFSGHEKMALQILKNLKFSVKACCLEEKSLFDLCRELKVIKIGFIDFPRLFYNKKVLLVSGSPYAFPVLKIFLWLLRSSVIEYTPFPELKSMRDRVHHYLMPIINKVTIRKRILIDEWQRPYSAVKEVIIVRNKV